MFDTSHLHPMLVHFPIALVVFGFVADLASLYFKKEVCLTKTSFYLLIIGTLAAIATWMSGILFTHDMSGAAGVVKETHELYAWITVGLLLITSVLRTVILVKKIEKPGIKWLAFIIYGLACISVTITGFFGGTLVYNYMMPL
jgi:uncharacterized membrane protein